MRTLAVDIETYSSIDLLSSGVYAYCQADDFDILLLAYAYDDGPVQILDLCGDRGPTRLDVATKSQQRDPAFLQIVQDLVDPEIMKTAFNANFERTCLTRYLGRMMPADQWSCTMVMAMTLGLPGNLAGVAEVMSLDQQKMEAGKALIQYFSKPCKPTKKNNMRARNLPQHDPEKWDLFKAYCVQDVETERAIRTALARYPKTEEPELWKLDQEINDRGVMIDRQLVENAIEFSDSYARRLEEEATNLTGLGNVKSVSQLKGWLQEQEGSEVTSLNKKDIPALMEAATGDNTQRVLELRQELAKSSITKYESMSRAVGPDDRVRGLLQFYGANRTGRWAGRLVQVQNLPQNHLALLDDARELLRTGDFEGLEMIFDNIPGVLSQLIRTAFIPRPGCRFVVADFSAIEARVIAWLAGESWRQEVFATHGKIYEASAAQMFRVPVESIKKGDPLRQKGKVAELALGYQGGPNALVKMGALDMGLTEDELPKLVRMWRNANPSIVKLWADVEEAAVQAVSEQKPAKLQYGLRFAISSGMLYIRLPSGRYLTYVNPRMDDNKFGNRALQYDGMDQQTRKWGPKETYGGKLVENIIQAIARDCLAESMLRLDRAGYPIVMHVHDEVILEVPTEQTDALEKACAVMGESLPWAPGLQLRADGFVCSYYQKD